MDRVFEKTMLKFINGPILVLAAAMVLFPEEAEAKIYKCVAGDGGVTYSQRPCAATEETSKVLQGASAREKFDCRVARSFSTYVANMMRSGTTSDDLFARYGGFSSISPTTVSVINYVYSHKENTDTSVNRIAALSGARCESGSYSRDIECEHFPQEFIYELGGCAAVKGEAPTRQQNNQSNDGGQYVPASNDDGDSVARRAERMNYDVLAETADDRQTLCREKLSEQIKTIQNKMRERLSVGEHNQLNAERRELRDQYEEC